MFLSVGHEKNVIYSKLVNNPFKESIKNIEIQIYEAMNLHTCELGNNLHLLWSNLDFLPRPVWRFCDLKCILMLCRSYFSGRLVNIEKVLMQKIIIMELEYAWLRWKAQLSTSPCITIWNKHPITHHYTLSHNPTNTHIVQLTYIHSPSHYKKLCLFKPSTVHFDFYVTICYTVLYS